MLDWEKCKNVFQPDGSLRDICITPATINDWRSLYPFLCSCPTVEYFVDGIAQTPPSTTEKVFSTRSTASPMLRLKIGSTLFVFHFFSKDEIECDFMPQEITSQSDLNSLLGFIRQLGDKVGKPVLLTPENLHESPLISYFPENGTFLYHEVLT